MASTHFSNMLLNKVAMVLLLSSLTKVPEMIMVMVILIFLFLRTPHIQICLLGASPSGCGSCQKPAWTLAAYHGYHKVLIKHLHGYHKVLIKHLHGYHKVLNLLNVLNI